MDTEKPICRRLLDLWTEARTVLNQSRLGQLKRRREDVTTSLQRIEVQTIVGTRTRWRHRYQQVEQHDGTLTVDARLLQELLVAAMQSSPTYRDQGTATFVADGWLLTRVGVELDLLALDEHGVVAWDNNTAPRALVRPVVEGSRRVPAQLVVDLIQRLQRPKKTWWADAPKGAKILVEGDTPWTFEHYVDTQQSGGFTCGDNVVFSGHRQQDVEARGGVADIRLKTNRYIRPGRYGGTIARPPKVHVDPNSGISGTNFPIGMPYCPVDNLEDAHRIAKVHGLPVHDPSVDEKVPDFHQETAARVVNHQVGDQVVQVPAAVHAGQAVGTSGQLIGSSWTVAGALEQGQNKITEAADPSRPTRHRVTRDRMEKAVEAALSIEGHSVGRALTKLIQNKRIQGPHRRFSILQWTDVDQTIYCTVVDQRRLDRYNVIDRWDGLIRPLLEFDPNDDQESAFCRTAAHQQDGAAIDTTNSYFQPGYHGLLYSPTEPFGTFCFRRRAGGRHEAESLVDNQLRVGDKELNTTTDTFEDAIQEGMRKAAEEDAAACPHHAPRLFVEGYLLGTLQEVAAKEGCGFSEVHKRPLTLHREIQQTLQQLIQDGKAEGPVDRFHCTHNVWENRLYLTILDRERLNQYTVDENRSDYSKPITAVSDDPNRYLTVPGAGVWTQDAMGRLAMVHSTTEPFGTFGFELPKE